EVRLIIQPFKRLTRLGERGHRQVGGVAQLDHDVHARMGRDTAAAEFSRDLPGLCIKGIGDTSLTELLATGRLRAKKFGKLVLIEGDSLQEFIESLPDATFGDNPPVRRPKDNTPRLEDDTPGASQRKARSAPSNAQPQIAAP
ncbi:MAG: hypothetical protein FWD12_11210, partial [Alphaproteobacteria bacterium]|nr:hypothetical protein [Alphaproteobacteria bacterium]